MPRIFFRFCAKHHWQHLDRNGRCPWCDREAREDEQHAAKEKQ